MFKYQFDPRVCLIYPMIRRRLRCDVITWSSLSAVLDAAGSTMELRRKLDELRRWARQKNVVTAAWKHLETVGRPTIRKFSGW